MDEATMRFIERVGLVAEQDGFPRTAGRMIGFLLLHEGAFSLDELAEELRVSKASVSTNARALVRLGVVERLSEPGDRRDYYRIGECAWEQIFAEIRRRMRATVDVLAEGMESVSPEMEAGRRRVADWRRFYAFLSENLDELVERWREMRVCAASE